MRSEFPLFHSPIHLSHRLWQDLVQESDILIDATAGNGHDSVFLYSLALKGKLYIIDIQKEALESTKNLFIEKYQHLPSSVFFFEQSHETFPEIIKMGSVKLIVYNLGYLPKGNKSITTQTETTLQSVQNALSLLKSGGVISITCYSGHPEGAHEEKQLLAWVKTLDRNRFLTSHFALINREKAPSLLLIQKKL